MSTAEKIAEQLAAAINTKVICHVTAGDIERFRSIIAAEIAAEAKERDERESALLATLKSLGPVLKATSPRIWAAVRKVINKAEKEMAAATAQGE